MNTLISASSMAGQSQYKSEDVEFYRNQERLARRTALAIQEAGFNTTLYVPPGGWRPKVDDERRKDPFPNQLHAAYRIFYELFCKQDSCVWIMLVALFQGGKTGVLQALSRLIMSNADKLGNRYGTYFTTSMNDISLIEQQTERLLNEYKEQIFHLPSIKKLECEIQSNIACNGVVKNTFIIDDESRVGSKTTNRKGDFMDLIKQSSPFETWRERNIRFLSVDATDPATTMNVEKLSQIGLAAVIQLELPPSYLSIEKLKQQGRLHEAKDLRDKISVIEFKEQIMPLWGLEPLWHIIRMPSVNKGGYESAKKHFEEVFGNNEFEFIEWNGKTKDIFIYENEEDDDYDYVETKNINDILEKPPLCSKPTFIFIKNMFYAGKTLNDKHIGAMYDRKSEKDDTGGQSFPGRVSGHNRSNRTHVWTNLDCIDRLINKWNKIMSTDNDLNVQNGVIITKDLHKRMPHIETIQPLGSTQLIMQTTGNEVTRPENLQNVEINNLPSRIREIHMGEPLGPYPAPDQAIRALNLKYGPRFNKFKAPRYSSIDGFFISSRLIGWYKKKYSGINSKTDLNSSHKLTMQQYESIAKTFGCSSRKGQPYSLYPVYPTESSLSSHVQWYVRYIKKEFTKYKNV
jgi:hypothetical protein